MIKSNKRPFLTTVPQEIRDWLQERAKYHGGSLSAEIVRSIRERMEPEADARAKAVR